MPSGLGWAGRVLAQAYWGGSGSLQVSLSAFAFLFSELVQYSQRNATHIGELEKKWVSETRC